MEKLREGAELGGTTVGRGDGCGCVGSKRQRQQRSGGEREIQEGGESAGE